MSGKFNREDLNAKWKTVLNEIFPEGLPTYNENIKMNTSRVYNTTVPSSSLKIINKDTKINKCKDGQ